MHALTSLFALAACLALISTETIHVNVGQYGQQFVPNAIKANVGDKVQFAFYDNHSVVESSFAAPCVPLPGGFYSGFYSGNFNFPCDVEYEGCRATNEKTVYEYFILTMNDTNAKWFYSSQYAECINGMVGVINQPNPWAIEDYGLAAQTGGSVPMMELTNPKGGFRGGVLLNITITWKSSIVIETAFFGATPTPIPSAALSSSVLSAAHASLTSMAAVNSMMAGYEKFDLPPISLLTYTFVDGLSVALPKSALLAPEPTSTSKAIEDIVHATTSKGDGAIENAGSRGSGMGSRFLAFALIFLWHFVV